MVLKNIIFDVGNVLVRWKPLQVIEGVFPEFDSSEFSEKMRPLWLEFNCGKFSEEEVIDQYQHLFQLPRERVVQFLLELKRHQIPLEGSIELLEELQDYHVTLFSLTDNIKEFVDYHKKFSTFPRYFKDIIVSAELGVLKPGSRLYMHLLTKHGLKASESIFIDDLPANVEGAIRVGMQGLQFTDSGSCRKQLLGLLRN